MNLLGIDKSSHQHQKKRLVYDIRTLIENILNPEMRNRFYNKQGEKVLYRYPEISFDEIPRGN